MVFLCLLSQVITRTYATRRVLFAKKQLRPVRQTNGDSAFLQIMSLSTVLKRPLFSVYPPVRKPIRAVLHGKIFPRPRLPESSKDSFSEEATLYLMFTRDSNLNSKSGIGFEPNHFVPLLPGPYSKDNPFVYKEDDFPTLESTCKSFSQDTSKRKEMIIFALITSRIIFHRTQIDLSGNYVTTTRKRG